MSRPYRLCFVCLGNICRSPMADAVTTALLAEAGLADRVRVASTGTGSWHVGGPADPGSVQALAGRGYDGSMHRAAQLTADRIADFDLLVALDRANLRDINRLLDRAVGQHRPEVALLRDYDPDSAAGQDVPDPYGMGPDAFDEVLDLVVAACRGLVAALAERVHAQRSDDA